MNEHKARQEALQRQQRQFLQALSSGQVHAVDRFRNKIEAGQKILFRPPYDLIFEVVSVTPLLDPNAPAGMITLHLAVQVPVHVQANVENPQLIIVGGAPHAQQTQPAATPAQPEPAEIQADVRGEPPAADDPVQAASWGPHRVGGDPADARSGVDEGFDVPRVPRAPVDDSRD
jgi:hypothetical protein